MTPAWIAFILGAYVIGSIPFGVIIARSKGVNIREHGSRNIGATNVGRVLGKRFGIGCFALDVIKGAAPVVASGAWFGLLGASAADVSQSDLWCWIAVAAAAVVGHMYSCFLKFAGGKGVATSFGGMIAMWPLLTIPAVAAIFVWIAALKTTKMVSLASIIAAINLPIAVVVQVMLTRGDRTLQDALSNTAPVLALTLVLAALVVIRHRSNLSRILRGEEPKVGTKNTSDS